ncbi:MAG: FAD-dependent oxidoreductase [Acidimicrobiia bacterium]|nr:FAD-dependent oxidoreductase [Acidimicrobiia bacterium]
MPDAVVIGAGPNGLVAANHLADRGWSVTVLEATDGPGGGVRSGEFVEPGFVNDWCSSFYPLVPGSPAIRPLELERFGLRWKRAPLVLAHPGLDGSCAVLSEDVADTARRFEAAHPGDGDAWLALHDRWRRVAAPFIDLLLKPFPPVKPAARLGLRLRSELVDFLRFSLLPVRRVGSENFAGDLPRRLLAGAALHGDLAPDSSISGFYGWFLCMLGHDYGFPVPEGGASELTNALVRRLEAGGGEVVCNSPVARVLVRKGQAVGVRLADGQEVPAARAVLADVNAPLLYNRLVSEGDLPSSFLQKLQHFHWDHATLKIDWTLDGPIPWTSPEAREAGTVHVTEGVDALTMADAQMVCGQIPAAPFLVMGQQSMTDGTRQPAGKETAWAYTHLPRQVTGDSAGEIDQLDDAGVQRLADRMQEQVEQLAPGFGSLIRHRHVMSPSDLEAHNPNLSGGAIAGGTMQLHQQLVFRPVPGLGRPETPIKRLYLASSSAHPGGGVHGSCGANAAAAAVLHHRLRFGR